MKYYFLKRLYKFYLLNLFFLILNLLCDSLSILFGAFLIFSLLDNIFLFNVLFRWTYLFVLIFIYFKFFSYYYKLLKNKINYLYITDIIDTTYNFNNQITSAYQLYNSVEYPIFFIEKLIEQSNNLIKKVKFFKFYNYKPILRKVVLTLFLSFILFFYYNKFPLNFKLSFYRFINPSYRIKYSHKLVKVKVIPGDKQIIIDSPLNIDIYTYGKVHKLFITKIIKNNKNMERITFTKQSNINGTNVYIYKYKISSVNESFKYYVTSIQTRDMIKINTPKYYIKVVKPPIIKHLKLIYKYPSYTGLNTKIVIDNGNIEAVEKSIIKIEGVANNNLKKGYIVYNNIKKKIAISDNKFYTSIKLKKSGSYFFRLKDVYNNTNINPVKYHIIVINDLAPEVNISEPGMDITISESLKIPITIFAQDDYLVHSLKLHYVIKHSLIEVENVWKEMNLPIKPSESITYKFLWNLNQYSFSSGDEIYYYATAYDGYIPSKNHIAKSKTYKIKFPTLLDIYKNINKEENEHIKKLEDLFKEQKEIDSQTERFLANLLEKNEISYVEKKQIEQFIKKEKLILKKSKELAKKLSKTIEKIEKNNLFSTEIIKKMKKINELINKINNKDIQKNIERLNNLLQSIKIDKNKIEKFQASFSKEKLLKNLEQTIKMLKKIQEEQKLQSFIKQTDNLIKKENKILNKTIKDIKKENNKVLSQEQNKLNDEVKELKNEIKNLLKDKDISKQLRNNLKSALKNISKIENNISESANFLKNKNFTDAITKEREIISQLNELKNNLNNSLMKNQQNNMAAIINSVNSLLFNFINISKQIEKLYIGLQLKVKNNNEIKFLTYEQGEGGNLNIEDFNKKAEELIYIERAIKWNYKKFKNETAKSLIINEAFENQFEKLYNSLEFLRNSLLNKRIYSSSIESKSTLILINQIIWELLQLKNEIKKEMANNQGSGMQNSLEDIANSQQQLNQLTQRLMGKIGKGEISPEFKKYLEQLAFQQELIRKATENFLKNYKEAGKLLGNLNKAAKEMEEIKKALLSKKIDKELLKKQNKVLKRLLDSEKSLYTKSKSEKREAEHAKSYKITPPPEVKLNANEKKENFSFFKENEKYPLEYKNLIDEYFKIINLKKELFDEKPNE